jgi:hypothetical protein
MGMVALDLRAAGQERNLLQHEMRSLLGSYQAEEAELQQAIAAAAARTGVIMQQQDATSEQLQAAGGPGQQWHELQRSYNSLLREQRELLGKQVLLRARCLRVQQLLRSAELRFGRYISSAGQQQRLTVEQLAEVADDEVQQQQAGAGSDGEDADDAEAALWEDEGAAPPAAGPAGNAAAAPGADILLPEQQGAPGAGSAARAPTASAAATEVWRFWWGEQVSTYFCLQVTSAYESERRPWPAVAYAPLRVNQGRGGI